MARWEYFRLVPYLEGDTWYVVYDGRRYKDEQLDAVLDALGEDGWELASSVELIHSRKPMMQNVSLTYTGAYQLIFKRPRPSPVLRP